MDLPFAGIEYAHHQVTGIPDNACQLELSYDGGTTWDLAEWVGDGPERTARILLAGPAATTPPAEAVTLTAGPHYVRARLTDTPEVVIRDAGVVDVKDPE